MNATTATENPTGLRDQGPRVFALACSLIALMALGSVLMWIGAPVGLVWLASHLQQRSQPSLGPYLVVMIGVPIAMIVIGKGLASLDRTFGRITGWAAQERRVIAPWHKSMRAEREAARRRSVLDVVMVISVVVAGLLFGIWFFLLAHTGAPQA